MFEAVELGRKLSKKDFAAAEPQLRMQLLEVQREARKAGLPVVILISGVEGSGKSEVVNRLSGWLDMRGVRTHAFFQETEEERAHPPYWRFWQRLPPRGTTAVMIGSWYTRPIVDRVYRRMKAGEFERELARIEKFERMLTEDGLLLVKFWFHITQKVQSRRLKKKGNSDEGKVGPLARKYAKRYDDFLRVSERAIRATDAGESPWHLIEATCERSRDQLMAQTLVTAIRERLERLARPRPEPASPQAEPLVVGGETTVLDRVDLDARLAKDTYRRRLARQQRRLHDLSWEAWRRGISTVAVFEGWDASGKGGAIRRLTAGIDARLYSVVPIAAPTDEERARHYLWRFWRKLPRPGYVTIFDRSWYGRLLVERVEGFATESEWKRAYLEINDFEEQLAGFGMVIAKFWLHISPEEQLQRFRAREKTPWKAHKITDEDWRNREKQAAYVSAVSDMVARTSTSFAPWTLVAGNDKKNARVQIVETLSDHLEAALERR